jgi:hypothetical protein
MAAFNADYFGSKNVGTVYGPTITAWQLAGVLGSQLISYTYGATGAPSTSPRGSCCRVRLTRSLFDPRKGRPVFLPELKPEHSTELCGGSV